MEDFDENAEYFNDKPADNGRDYRVYFSADH